MRRGTLEAECTAKASDAGPHLLIITVGVDEIGRAGTFGALCN